MSYSTNIKDEIMNKKAYTDEEFMAVLYRVSPEGIYRTTNTFLARNILALSKKMDIPVKISSKKAFRNQNLHSVNLPAMRWNTPLSAEKSFLLSFLFMGTMSHPSKDYRLEFVSKDQEVIDWWISIFKTWDWKFRKIERRNRKVLYTKNSEWISEALYLLDAMNLSVKLENSKIIRSLKRDITQVINFEVANQQRILQTSDEQISKIQWLQKEIGLSSLSQDLAEIASLRLDYPEASLSELGEKTQPPITKSAVSYRFKKLNKLIENLRG